jgi:SprT protein
VTEKQNQNPLAVAENAVGRHPTTAELMDLRARVQARTTTLLREFGELTNAEVEIRFDLRGKAAGQVRIRGQGRYLIRYNLELLKRGGQDFLEQTVPHEVAHVLACHRFGRNIRPHGREWKAIMGQLGAEPTRCHDYDVGGLAARELQYFDYHCGCMVHRLSSIRHNKVAKGQRYLCRRCGEPLQPAP